MPKDNKLGRVFVFVTEDEGYDPAGTISRKIAACLRAMKIDSYNEQYVVRVTVDKLTEVQEGGDE